MKSIKIDQAYLTERNTERSIRCHYTRDEIIGCDTVFKISNLGVTQFRNNYCDELLETILNKAIRYKERFSEKRHLNLRYIRAAQIHIPEIYEI